MTKQSEIRFKNWRPRSSQEKLAKRLILLLKQAGFAQTYIVGGYVRDLLLTKQETGMIDVATEAAPEKVSRLLAHAGFRVIPTGLKHGTVTVHRADDNIEITTFRREGKYLDFRRPAKVSFVKSPQIDSARRDFTVNAFYFDPQSRRIYDFQSGFGDLKAGRLRFVGSAKKRIAEDALRLLRAVRFATVLNFKPAPSDLEEIKNSSRLIGKISAERVKAELDKILLSPRRAEGLRLLLRTGILKHILPEIESLTRAPQSKNYHSEGNVFKHTLLALSQVEPSADLKTLYGLLFHDAGKAATVKRTRKNNRAHMSFYGHQQIGEELTKKALSRLRFSNADIKDIAWLVRNHHVPYELSKMRRSKQMTWCLDPRFGSLLQIFRADTLSSIPTDAKGKKKRPSLVGYNYALKTWKQAKSRPSFSKKLIDGYAVMKILKIGPGPQVGRVLNQIRDLQLGGKIKDKKQALKYLKSFSTSQTS